MLLLSTFIGKQVFAPPDLQTVYYTPKSYDFFFFFCLQLLNLILHSSQFLEYRLLVSQQNSSLKQ